MYKPVSLIFGSGLKGAFGINEIQKRGVLATLFIAICDDNIVECTRLSQKIQKMLSAREIEAVMMDFYSGQALSAYRQNFDILFLDIKMAVMDGLETAKILKERGQEFILIFITSAEEYVYDAFDLEAFQYLVKPVNDEKLERVLFAAVNKRRKSKENFLIFSRNRQVSKVNLDDVLYFEITGRITRIHFKDRCADYYEKISDLERKLSALDFFRCHKSYLVNLNFVREFTKTEIIMENGERLLLSRRRSQDFSRAFLSCLKRQGGLLDTNIGESV